MYEYDTSTGEFTGPGVGLPGRPVDLPAQISSPTWRRSDQHRLVVIERDGRGRP